MMVGLVRKRKDLKREREARVKVEQDEAMKKKGCVRERDDTVQPMKL